MRALSKEIYIGSAVIILLIGYLIYGTIPRKTWDYGSDASRQNGFMIVTPTVKVGEKLQWLADICRFSSNEYVVERTVKNLHTGVEVTVDRVDDLPLGKGECKTLPRELVLPFHVEQGASIEISCYDTRRNSKNIDEVCLQTGTFYVIK